jgi:hypothetical protein
MHSENIPNFECSNGRLEIKRKSILPLVLSKSTVAESAKSQKGLLRPEGMFQQD